MRMTSNYYFHGVSAMTEATNFADENKEFYPEIHDWRDIDGSIVVVLSR